MQQYLLILLRVFYFLLLARIILSWVSGPWSRNPAVRLIHDITEPVLAPFRRILPPMGGMDFSPILLFLLLGWLERIIRSGSF